MSYYSVQQGDTIASIAYRHGIFWEYLWNLSENVGLKKNRDPNLLREGDEVFIPEVRKKQESCATDSRHRFKRKGVPAKFRMRFTINNKPRADESYDIDIDGVFRSGTTDSDGWLEESILPNAKKATVVFANLNKYEFKLGHLDPPEDISGYQGRLRNMGYYSGAVDGRCGEMTRSAIRDFQAEEGVEVTGEMDDTTRDKLKSKYGL